MKEAIKDSGLEEKEVSNFRSGIVMGSGGPSIENVILAADKTRAKTPKLMGPFIVPGLWQVLRLLLWQFHLKSKELIIQ